MFFAKGFWEKTAQGSEAAHMLNTLLGENQFELLDVAFKCSNSQAKASRNRFKEAVFFFLCFEEEGKIDGRQVGPNPTLVAERHLRAMNRLSQAVNRFFPDRPVRIVMVSHSSGLDATLHYIVGQGKISSQNYKEIGKSIEESEPIIFELDADSITAGYRGKKYRYDIAQDHDKI